MSDTMGAFDFRGCVLQGPGPSRVCENKEAGALLFKENKKKAAAFVGCITNRPWRCAMT